MEVCSTSQQENLTSLFCRGVCNKPSKVKNNHLAHVKRILRYINRTCDYDVLYSQETNSILVGYCDAGWDGSVDDRRSTYGDASFLAITQYLGSARRKIVSLSTVEAEYIFAGSNYTQLLWMKQILKEYNVGKDVMTLFYDNLSSINI